MKRSTMMIGLLLATGCARNGQVARLVTACAQPTGAALATITPTDIAQLAGDFRLVQVVTSDSVDGISAFETPLTLAVADSTQRARARERRLGNRPRDFQMVGARRWPSQNMQDPAELDGIYLRLGCVECTDASPDYLRIEHVTPTGFSGRWGNAQTGIGRIVRANGTLAPDPAGHFCAQRVSSVPRGDV
jgi:hypothetical protein